MQFDTLTDARLTAAGTTYLLSDALQRFTRVRYLRIALVRFHTPETAVDPFGGSYDTQPLFRVSNLVAMSRCSCNGHASDCQVSGDGTRKTCVCQHNTQGATCNTCLPLFNRKPWKRGISADEPNICQPCECNNHAQSCTYNATLDTNPSSRTLGDGGVCDNCADNTAGQRCETCAPGFYENPAVSRSDPNACLPCTCKSVGNVGQGICNVKTGQCPCKTNVQGFSCDSCKDGFFGISDTNPDGCAACVCNPYGTVNASTLCDKATGQCPCNFGNTGVSCDRCMVGFFLPRNAAAGQCVSCNEQCDDLGCTDYGANTKVCIRCRNFEDNGQCVSSCGSFKYPDVNKVCQLCHEECLGGCKSGEPTVASCTACKNFAYNGVCVPRCPDNTYADGNRECRPCHAECIGCTGPKADQCNACRNSLDAGVCVSQCPISKFRSAIGVCEACHAQCEPSLGCSGPESYQCNRCAQFVDNSNPAIKNNCVAACPGTSYLSLESSQGNTNASVCRACNSECAIGCSGPLATQCTNGCKNFFDSVSKACTSACPSHTYLRPNTNICAACSSACAALSGCVGPTPADCNVCDAKAVTLDGKCLLSCPSGYFADQSRVCQACDSQCLECTGFGPTKCVKCKSFSFLDTCVDQCPALLSYLAIIETTTTTAAPAPTSDDQSGDEYTGPLSLSVCTPCNEQCSGGCRGPNATQCITCKSVEYNGVCMTSCPPMTYQDTFDRTKCYDCDAQCDRGCTGPAPSQCVACKNFLTPDRTCVQVCPSSQYPTQAKTCSFCHSQCSLDDGCTGPLSTQCKKCRSFLLESTGECIASCPFQTYADGTTCRACNSECLGCTGPRADQCLACKSYRLDGTCVSACPIKTHPDGSNNCVPCDPQCSYDCFSLEPTGCIAKSPTDNGCASFRVGATCVSSCNREIAFPNITAKTCDACHPACDTQGCTGPAASDCIACAFAKDGKSCVSACAENKYLAVDSTCQACHPECAPGASGRLCFGPSASECNACARFISGSTCVASCDLQTEYVGAGGKTCLKCSSQCQGGCTGPTGFDCKACRAWKYSGNCIAVCPVDTTTRNADLRECLPCNSECATFPGSGGCPSGISATDCAVCKGVRRGSVCQPSCNLGEYADTSDTSTALLGVCKTCHAQCAPFAGCTGGRADQCVNCTNFEYNGQCFASCPARTYLQGKRCIDCDENCRIGCTGAGSALCNQDRTSFELTAAALGCRTVALVSSSSRTDCLPRCPLGFYADASSICQKCSPLCPATTGCVAPGLSGCNACPETQYNDGHGSCQSCHVNCKLGCTGPTEVECNECDVVRFEDKCVASCDQFNDFAKNMYYFVDTSLPTGGPRCTRCHPECAPGGCAGPRSDQCLFGCNKFTSFALTNSSSGLCMPSCGTNSFVTDRPVQNTCTPCSEQCVGGCRDASPKTCVACAHAKTRDGECVSMCPENEIISANGTCVCPSDRAFLSAGKCQLCSSECANGCAGPSASQCLGGPMGCRGGYFEGKCVPECPEGMVVTQGVCQCKSNFYFSGSSGCKPCHPQCFGGCTGGLASQCTNCQYYIKGADCVQQCGNLEMPLNRICTACHEECATGCYVAADARQCQACRHYSDAGTCVESCPASKMFVYAGACRTSCPESRPYFNDTRLTDSEVLEMPQLCVAGCSELNDPLRGQVSKDFPYRCSTLLRIQADASKNSKADTTVSLVAAIVGSIALLMIIVAIMLLYRHHKRSKKEELSMLSVAATSTVTTPRKAHMNTLYQSPSPARGGGGNGGRSAVSSPITDFGSRGYASSNNYTFDPQYDVPVADFDEPYMDVSTMNGQDDDGGYIRINNATIPNPYAMTDDAFFNDFGKNVQSTHM